MARTTINTQVIPDGTIVSADLSYPLTDFSSTGIDDNATTTAITIDSSGNITVTGTVDGRDLATDGTKLDGIEASADVTDTANVTAAGALMDSEVTNLAQVKAFSSSDYATAAQGTTADSALQNIVEDITPQLGGDLASNGSDILFADSDKAIFGAGSDLQIYHDGSNSIVQEVGTGDLRLAGNVVRVRNSADTENMISAVQDGPVTLCFDGNGKLATTSTGIDVTGTVTSDGLTLANATYISQSDSASVQPRVFGLNPSNNMYIGPIDSYAGGSIFYGVSSGVSSQVLYTGGTERMRIDSSGNVGIGTSSPSNRLHVASSSTDVAKFATTGAYTFVSLENATRNWALSVGSGFGIYDSTAASTRMLIDSSGNVGIGNTPVSKLDVEGEVRVNASADHLKLVNSATTARFDIAFEGGSNADALTFTRVGVGERMRIDSSGNVGIGTASPASYAKLTVESSGLLSRSTANDVNCQISTLGSAGLIQSSTIAGNATPTLFYNGGTETMRIDSYGNVGIGTTSPDGKLNVFSASAGSVSADADADELVLENSGNVGLSLLTASTGESGIYFGNPGTNGQKDFYLKYYHESHATTANRRVFTFNTASTERMRIDSSGNVGIGTTGPTSPLSVVAASGGGAIDVFGRSADGLGWITYRTNNGSSSHALIGTPATNTLAFYTNGFSERMRIDSSGNVRINATTGQAVFSVYNAGSWIMSTETNSTGTVGHIRFENGNGLVGSVITSGSSTSFNTSSDERLKENIVDAPAGNIDAVRVRSFDWKADGSHQTYGMVAQELVDVAPEAVSQGETEDDMWGVDYSKLVPMMIKEIQDLKAEVAALRGV